MRIVDAEWDITRNYLLIECQCSNKIKHPADKWTVLCHNCYSVANLKELRDKYLKDNLQPERSGKV